MSSEYNTNYKNIPMDLSPNKTAIMGILNITPDSFSDGGIYYQNPELALSHAEVMIADGVDIIDLGGQSTRPGAEIIPPDEEIDRILPILHELNGNIRVAISVDTFKPAVASIALENGASIINDITGLTDPAMRAVVSEHRATAVIMHMQGNPETMQEHPHYTDVIKEIREFFLRQIDLAIHDGITDLILDPGIGFGKTVDHNLEILRRLSEFSDLGYPLLIGASRKSFIGHITGLPVTSRLEGTCAANVVASMNGANIVRVHDVKQTSRALQVSDAIKFQK